MSLQGGLQHLGDYLRIDTTALSNEISKAEKAYATAKIALLSAH